ncbi:YggT family protein [Gorillibacterium sp. CAU 1737]|uniref:YggT family protein n=1 Tax=Gorillibacterium sp. CAU 1737 TaxID=3140362 RepID=UPI0032601145
MIYSFLVIAYILMSWLPNVRQSRVGEIIGRIVEPYLAPFRKLIPPIGGMIDISPMLAIFLLYYVYLGIDYLVILLYKVLT